MYNKKLIYFLLLITAAYLCWINHITFPRWIATLYDPSYPYLYNGIDWINGSELFLWGHPGVFVHWVHFIILTIYSILTSVHNGLDLANHSEQILYVIGVVNIFLFVGVSWFCYFIMKSSFKTSEILLFFALIVSTININEIISNTPETYLVLFAPLFVALLVSERRNTTLSNYLIVGLGTVAAILISTKYTAVFLLASVVLIVKPRKWGLFSIVFGLSTIVLFYPIYSKVVESIQWLWGLISQPGFGYGVESESVSKGLGYFVHFFVKSLLFDKPWFLSFIATLGFFIYDFKSIWKNGNRIQICGLLFLLIVSILVMTYKEMFRYFVPSKYILILFLFVVLDASESIKELRLKHIKVISISLFIISISYLSLSQYRQITRFKWLEEFSYKMEEAVSNPDYATIRMFTTSSPQFARFFGSYYSNGNYITSEKDYYLMYFSGNYYASFNEWNLLDKDKKSISLNSIFDKGYKKVFLIGRKSATSTPFWVDNKLVDFKVVLSKNDEYLYELTLK